ncbi:hypothetical protein BT63DRAFT_188869 [Microthyrium microscopicum]|uniref:MARVEL domain-containing protein n=1 Tax=Microthyrium microscopicum TaxID=703497 RepID=A0A6A6UM16_9PEZI|nr:hypothetical protein BT63DRAFT_188869 [Microthyrium microscopicum]
MAKMFTRGNSEKLHQADGRWGIKFACRLGMSLVSVAAIALAVVTLITGNSSFAPKPFRQAGDVVIYLPCDIVSILWNITCIVYFFSKRKPLLPTATVVLHFCLAIIFAITGVYVTLVTWTGYKGLSGDIYNVDMLGEHQVTSIEGNAVTVNAGNVHDCPAFPSCTSQRMWLQQAQQRGLTAVIGSILFDLSFFFHCALFFLGLNDAVFGGRDLLKRRPKRKGKSSPTMEDYKHAMRASVRETSQYADPVPMSAFRKVYADLPIGPSRLSGAGIKPYSNHNSGVASPRHIAIDMDPYSSQQRLYNGQDLSPTLDRPARSLHRRSSTPPRKYESRSRERRSPSLGYHESESRNRRSHSPGYYKSHSRSRRSRSRGHYESDSKNRRSRSRKSHGSRSPAHRSRSRRSHVSRSPARRSRSPRRHGSRSPSRHSQSRKKRESYTSTHRSHSRKHVASRSPSRHSHSHKHHDSRTSNRRSRSPGHYESRSSNRRNHSPGYYETRPSHRASHSRYSDSHKADRRGRSPRHDHRQSNRSSRSPSRHSKKRISRSPVPHYDYYDEEAELENDMPPLPLEAQFMPSPQDFSSDSESEESEAEEETEVEEEPKQANEKRPRMAHRPRSYDRISYLRNAPSAANYKANGTPGTVMTHGFAMPPRHHRSRSLTSMRSVPPVPPMPTYMTREELALSQSQQAKARAARPQNRRHTLNDKSASQHQKVSTYGAHQHYVPSPGVGSPTSSTKGDLPRKKKARSGVVSNKSSRRA